MVTIEPDLNGRFYDIVIDTVTLAVVLVTVTTGLSR
jgi:hypothetical protein